MANIDVDSESSPRQSATACPEPPLCVDLDGTLLATDSLWEAMLLLAHNRPADLLYVPFWIAGGRAHFKDQLADRVKIDVAHLPYRQDVLDYIRQEKAAGRRIVLATASHRKTADAIVAHPDIFDGVIASGDGANFMEIQARRDAAATEKATSTISAMPRQTSARLAGGPAGICRRRRLRHREKSAGCLFAISRFSRVRHKQGLYQARFGRTSGSKTRCSSFP